MFGADRTYFVLNGTSTSNKVVTNAVLRRGDLVLFDRNNHKSLHQGALVQAGAIPIFLPTARNAFGMIGAVDWDAWDENYLREQIRANPLVTDPSARQAPSARSAWPASSSRTYDGTIYNVRKVLEKIGHLCDYVLWDEAWIGYNAFHPLFEDHSPMRLENLTPDMPGLFSTQSVHKQGAGFSQASQIHKRDEHIRGQRRYIEHKRFNESFLMNASTSPFYPLFASLDVNAKIHEGKAGEMLWDRCIELGIEARKKLREFGHYYARTGRERAGAVVLRSVRARRGDDPRLAVHATTSTDVPWERPAHRGDQARAAVLELPARSAAGTATPAMRDGYAMVDPNKLTLLTPGIDRKTGEYLDFGVPATVVANYLREQRVVPEKCDLNSILFLMTPAEDESKLNTLIAKLVKFKNLWDRDAPLAEVLPTLYAAHGERYAGYTLRQVCNEMHDFYRERERQGPAAAVLPRRRASPSWRCRRRRPTRRWSATRSTTCRSTEVKGRISATLALIYPPGIGVVVPGERWDERAQPMLDYFLAFEESFNRFPGFNYEVQGVYQERVDGRINFHTYVVREVAAAGGHTGEQRHG